MIKLMKSRNLSYILLVLVFLNFIVEGADDKPIIKEKEGEVKTTTTSTTTPDQKMMQAAVKEALKEIMADANFLVSLHDTQDSNHKAPEPIAWANAILKILENSAMGWVSYVYWGIIAFLLVMFVGTLVWACMINKEKKHLDEELKRVTKSLEILRKEKVHTMKGQIDTIRAENGQQPIHGTKVKVTNQEEQDTMWMSAFVQNGQQNMPPPPPPSDPFETISIPSERIPKEEERTDVIDVFEDEDLAAPIFDKESLNNDYMEEGMYDDAMFGGMPDDVNGAEDDAKEKNDKDPLAEFFG